MDTSPKTKFFRLGDVERKWYIVDATGLILGRAASQVAKVLRGKHKPTFTPNADVGDFIVVINADKVIVIGKRNEMKEYFHNSGYPGGAVFESYKELSTKKPEWIFEHAVKGMLPHTTLGRRMFKKLKVYAGADHPHAAQKPEPMKINY